MGKANKIHEEFKILKIQIQNLKIQVIKKKNFIESYVSFSNYLLDDILYRQYIYFKKNKEGFVSFSQGVLPNNQKIFTPFLWQF